MQFSVIIPAYNIEKYIARSIKSVLMQTYTNFELIVVNDGSTDNTKRIIEKEVQKDSRIVLVNKKNGGLSSARKAGILISKGNYIVFLDGDDKLHDKFVLEKMHRICIKKNPEVIVGGMKAVNSEGKAPNINLNFQLKKDIAMDSLEKICNLYIANKIQPPWQAFRLVIRKDIIKNNNVLFNEKTATQEDFLFFFNLNKYVHKLILTNTIFVDYTFERQGSITLSMSFTNLKNAFTNFSYVYNLTNDKSIRTFLANRFCDYIPYIVQLKPGEQKESLAFLKENKKIIDNSGENFKNCVYKYCWKIFGLRYGSKVILSIKGFLK